LRNGYTTGSTATAAALYAAIYQTSNKPLSSVEITLPDNSVLNIPVGIDKSGVFAVKDAGDDIDVTDKMKIYASLDLNESGEITIKGGQGIGRVTKSGLQIPVGQHAINPVPRKMIADNIKPLLEGRGAVVTIYAPEGERIAKETFNEKIGIIGGISIIGTTGIVTPMSVDAIIETIKCEIDVAVAEKKQNICLVPGKLGEKHLLRQYPNMHPIQISNYAGEALKYAFSSGIKDISIAGHPGKLCKLSMGYYNTHSKHSPMAQDWLAEKLELKGDFNTVEDILTHPKCPDMSSVASELGKKLEKEFGFTKVSIIFYNMKGGNKGERI
jgi:cobalt-precorrin-5B (C1)-methyltransferase